MSRPRASKITWDPSLCLQRFDCWPMLNSNFRTLISLLIHRTDIFIAVCIRCIRGNGTWYVPAARAVQLMSKVLFFHQYYFCCPVFSKTIMIKCLTQQNIRLIFGAHLTRVNVHWLRTPRWIHWFQMVSKQKQSTLAVINNTSHSMYRENGV